MAFCMRVTAYSAVSMVIFAAVASAAPVVGEVFDLRQPDGSFVKARIWGDEYYQVVESLDGYTLMRHPVTQEIQYARLAANGRAFLATGHTASKPLPQTARIAKKLRLPRDVVLEKVYSEIERFEAGDAPAMKSTGPEMAAPCVGNVAGLCLIVQFPDEAGTIPAAEVAKYCNQVGYTGYSNNGSVRDYFHDVSDGALTYTNFVPPVYYTALHEKAYYDNPAEDCGPKARVLVQEALTALNAAGFDFSDYDANGDGRIDAINCFYAGTCSSGWSKGLWPHSWTVSYSADGVSAYKYQITDMKTQLTLGTFCHENGHMVCYWPDLYDYGYESNGVGRYCVMAFGGSNGSGRNPAEPCAYLKHTAGWADLTELTSPAAALFITAGVNSFYRFSRPADATEYFLMENRQRSGRDAGLPDGGLAIWHIDTLGSNDYEQMTPSQHYMVTLVQADGLWNLERKTNYGDATDLFDAGSYSACGSDTNPNTSWWDSIASGMCVHSISANGGVMTFAVGDSLAPTAAFSAAPTTGAAPLDVKFTDASTGAITTWVWDFGDGQQSNAQNPTHTYANPGTYTVSLRVLNTSGEDVEAKTGYVVVNDVPVTASFASAACSVGECDGARNLVVALSKASALQITVPFSLGGTASLGADYTVSPASQVVFAPGATQATIAITPIDDTAPEGDETVLVTLGAPTGAQLGAPSAHTVTILEDELLRILVDRANTSGVEDGAAWATAYNTIQEGISAAATAGIAEVWVREGVYDEPRVSNLTGVNTGSVVLATNVALYGGFNGTESSPDDRQWIMHPTVIDGSTARDGQPAYHVVWGGYGARIDGFFITGGVANRGEPGVLDIDTLGGGMLCWGADTDIANCRFEDNGGEYGAALSIVSANIQVSDCSIGANTGVSGAGGVFCFNASPVFTRCNISLNSGGYSGGVDIWSGAPSFLACGFQNNDGMHGGAVFAWNAQPEFAQCTFTGNVASLGASLFLYETETLISRCWFEGNTGFYGGAVSNWYGANNLVNCVVAGNSAHLGGGMFNVGCAPTVLHCTVAGNTAAAAGGALYNSDASAVVTNSILWGNTPGQISDSGSGLAETTYSDVQGGRAGTGNIDADPQFTFDGYELQSGSPCIDAADSASTPAEDYAGTPRPQGSGPDMGAYESE